MSSIPVKKKTETNKHYIIRLQRHIELVAANHSMVINTKDMINNELKENFNVVSKLEHDVAKVKIEELRAALKKYGLWTGQ